MGLYDNPYERNDPDRRFLWDRLIRADIDAFIAGDWEAVRDDFDADRFLALDAGFSADPLDWTIGFPTLDAYRIRWLAMSEETRRTADPARLREAMFSGVRIARLDFFAGDTAILHKMFDGATPLAGGGAQPYAWQSVFTLARTADRWRVTSFVGYMR